MKHNRIIIILIMTTVVLSFIIAASTSAVSQNTITVTSLSDNANAGDNFCTLREAINNANADGDTTGGDCEPGSGDDIINIPSGPFLLLNTGPDDDANLTGDLDIMSSLTLQGAGSGLTLLDGDQEDRVLHIVTPGVVVEVNGVFISNGHVEGGTLGNPDSLAHGGGGIFNEGGTLTLNNTIVQGNLINNSGNEDGSGAGILNVDGRLTLNNSLVSNNHISGTYNLSAGAGIMAYAQNANADLTLIESTVDLNTFSNGDGIGGGIVAASAGGVTVTVTIHQSHIAGNEAGFVGGILIGTVAQTSAISATISSSLIENNRAESNGGAEIVGEEITRTHVLIKDSTFQNNESVDIDPVLSGGWGGALYADTVMITILGSTFANNRVEQMETGDVAQGAGVVIANSTAVIANSTISGNEAVATSPGASSRGGGLTVFSNNIETSVTILNSTIVSNTAENGGGIALYATSSATPTIRFQNTIIAANTATTGPNQNCMTAGSPVALISLGNNLEDANTCALDQPTDLPNTDPLLSPLQDNGGPTHTHNLLDYSPAIDNANYAACQSPPVSAVDQRGVPRPGPRCDIGAVETAALSPYRYLYLPAFYNP